MNCIGIIPARYASTRFPGKPLAIIDGKSMIQRVYEQVSMAESLIKVIVATDDDRIADHVKSFGANVCMTSEKHNSGTDRCFEVVENLNKSDVDIIINIQGDEPFINPAQIDLLASCFADNSVEIATLIKRIECCEDIFNPNVVKVVKDIHNRAVYFSRSAIPFQRGVAQEKWLEKGMDYYKHIGIYAYRTATLKKIVSLPLSSLEKTESLEQLRWIENGYTIYTATTEFESIAIDTPEDLKKLSR
ncbi:MAG: 3-deoxy-manno-octulosonate cytidylyltransferase [Bacteroidetes bacterium]|nr:3-deoxy-manno-octulosonate cytidylyltransferase [Bacteroidota bacterium]